MANSIFDPYKKKLKDYKVRLQIVVDGIENFDVSAYASIPEITKGIKDLRNDLNANIAHVMNNMNTTEATLAASVAAKAPSGIAKSVKGIAKFVLEIKAAAECFKLIGEIVVLLTKIPILIGKKVVDLSQVLTTLALDKVQGFLEELKTNLVKKINEAKAKAVAETKTKFYKQQSAILQNQTKDLENSIKSRTDILKQQGKTEIEITNDDSIKAWKGQAAQYLAKISILKDSGLI